MMTSKKGHVLLRFFDDLMPVPVKPFRLIANAPRRVSVGSIAPTYSMDSHPFNNASAFVQILKIVSFN